MEPSNYTEVAAQGAFNVLAYRSVATSPPTETDVQRLLRAAQARNKAEGLTGVLIYDQGEFFQWLEGPADALGRVWNSILQDPRHRHITVLRDEPIADRVFDGWDLRIARGAEASVEGAVAALESSQILIGEDLGKAKIILEPSWEDLFATIVVPRLRLVHGRDEPGGRRLPSTPVIWHAELNSGAKLASVLIAPEVRAVSLFVDTLLEEGASVNALYQEVFEPAQLHLGQMWEDDRCDDFHLTIALARLQIELLRVNAAVPDVHLFRPNMRVLLSAQPQEAHRIGLMMSSEIFRRRGWDVNCPLPGDDRMLSDLVHEQWFDVIKLSQSSSLRRDYRLTALRDTIDSARAASLNPALIVLVDGRTVVERPELHRALHANASSRTVLEAAPLAETLLAACRSASPNFQRTLS